jgi:hypothetical protein
VRVVLTADRDRYEPGDTTRVAVRTTDASGRPVPATVLLRGVDAKLVAMGVAGFSDPIALTGTSRCSAGGASHPIVLSGPDGEAEPRAAGTEGRPATGAGGVPRRPADAGDHHGRRGPGAGRLHAARRPHDPADRGNRADREPPAGAASIGIPVGLPFFVEATPPNTRR